MAGRLIFQSFTGLSGAILSASSEDASFPVRRLRDSSPSALWRSKLGWNITASFNDRLDFTEGTTGAAVASIAVGNYATGALMAAQIQTAINDAATDNTYTCTFNTATGIFTIARDAGTATIDLDFATGPTIARSVHLDLGYASTDVTGATSYAGDNAAWHSREWVKVQAQTAVTGTVGIAVNHNLAAAGTVTLQGHASDAWSSPTVDSELSDFNVDPMPLNLKFITSQSLIYWRLVFADVANAQGYSECGVFHVSNYVEPGYDFAIKWSEGREELSDVEYADQGASYTNEKPTRKFWPLRWPALTPSEKDQFDVWMNFVKAGRPFFFAFDPDDDANFVHYVILAKGGKWVRVPPNYWALSATIGVVLP